MNGMLEEPKTKQPDVNSNLEAWSKKPKEEMDDSELAKLEQYLEQCEKIWEDNEKWRKILGQELKKINSEIKNTCTEFD